MHTPLEQFPTPLAGVDEAGRGCLAGPVVAAAVILPDRSTIYGLTDSKKISPSKRTTLAREVRSQALAWALGLSWPMEIDRINILQATLLAMNRAVDRLKTRPSFVLIDGGFSPGLTIPHSCIPRADFLYAPVSAASILAKTYRDRLMVSLDRLYPDYGFSRHKGYGTRLHINNLKRYGPSRLHRKSFRPVFEQSREKQGWLPGI